MNDQGASTPRARADSTPGTAGPCIDRGATGPYAGALPGLPLELVDHPTYEVQRELGRGGMGVVYLARNKLLDRLEVLKVMQDRLTGRGDLAQRFIKEVQLAARVQHPNIATAYAAIPISGALVLAMEYVEGHSLAEVVRRKGPLSVTHACHFARQVALGLQRAHEAGLVHRDIKPQNLMVTKRGEVKVLDFGLAKVASEEGDSSLTGTGAMMGTPDYMPPEQATDARSADIRADLYSLGCTLFHLLTGKPPFTGRSSFEVMQAHQSQPAPPLAALRSDAPEELGALLNQLLAKRPADRPQAPADVARALAKFCTAAPPEEKSGSVPPSPKATVVPRGRAVPPLEVPAPPPPPEPRTAVPHKRSTLHAAPAATQPSPPRHPVSAGGRRGLLAGAALVLILSLAGLVVWASGWLSPSGTTPEAPGGTTRPADAPPYDVELLLNAGAEEPITRGWVKGQGNWERRSVFPKAFEGTYYLAPSKGKSKGKGKGVALGLTAELYQEVDVSRYQATIDGEGQHFQVSGHIYSAPPGKKKKADICKMVVEFRAHSREEILAQLDLGPDVSVGQWKVLSRTGTAPKGTRFIRFRLISLRRGGDNNDGYFDALSLRAVPPAKRE